MDDAVYASHRVIEEVDVPYIPPMLVQRAARVIEQRIEVLLLPSGEVVVDADFRDRLSEQLLDDMAPDEPGPTDDQDASAVKFHVCLRNLSVRGV